MLKCFPVLKQHFHDTQFERLVVAKNHLSLLHEQSWNFAMPSKSLPVLDVLVRSGTVVEGLDRASSASLLALQPCMTTREKSVLNEFYSMLPGNLAHPRARDRLSSPNARVRKMYGCLVLEQSALKEEDAQALFKEIDEDFIKGLETVETLMLFEVALKFSAFASSACFDGVAERTKAFLIHCEPQNTRHIWWVLVLLKLYSDSLKSEHVFRTVKKVFSVCVSEIHRMIPQLGLTDRIVALLCLQGVPFPSPFVVVRELEKNILETPVDEHRTVPCAVLLYFMHSKTVQHNKKVLTSLILSFYRTGRIVELTLEETLDLLMLLSQLHREDPEGALVSEDPREEWDTLHDAIFAQIHCFSGDLSVQQTIRVFEQLDAMSTSDWSTPTPFAFSDKLKKHFFKACKKLLSNSEQLKQVEAEATLEALLRFKRISHRCTVVSCSVADCRRVDHCITVVRAVLTKL
ncbi:hypothetical protein, conserved [Angomonas deanei]|uniref:Uncharacterized protein n=1 Tax=Angomonas deanei TaxID=59799 RepID=A0A7G2CM38_9TRYP|nr:hypothetical protein, conserved [Angomonas deanei]